MFSELTNGALDRLHDAIRIYPQWRWEVDENYCYTKVSQSLTGLLGRDGSTVIGKPIYAFMLPDEAARVSRALKAKSRRSYSGMISQHLRADGATIMIESSAVSVQDNGVLKGYRGIAQPVTQLDPLQSCSGYGVREIYDTAPAALCLIDRHGRFLAANNAYAAIYGLTPDAIVGRKLEELLPGAGDMVLGNLNLLDAGHDVPAHEVIRRGRTYQASAKPMKNLIGQVVGITVALMDITERKLAEQELARTNRQLQHFARHDYLTGLSNRRDVDEVLANEVRRAMRAGQSLSLLMADVDFFKRYNDHYGHLLGDECLQALAAQFKSVLQRSGDFSGRYGGEEFVAIMPCTDAAGASKIAETILQATRDLNLPHAKSSCGKVTLSIGAATFHPGLHQLSGGDANCEALLRAADQALYMAKHAGRNTVRCASLPESTEIST